MKKVLFATLVNLLLSVVNISSAQNFSNKGKLFWAGHMRHIGGISSTFALYITTDAKTDALVRVTIPGGTYNQLVTVPPNTVQVVTLPSTSTYMNCTDCTLPNAVKIESLNHDIVVYAHIYNDFRSDATLLLPVETLSKEYYAISYTQNPVDTNSRSQILVIGVEDSTYVDITPRVALLPSRPANNKYTVMLNSGDSYQVQSSGDLTGTHIFAHSASSATCKKMAVFSGSSFVRMGCGGASSGDNLFKQLFPTSSWGTQFLTAPLKTRNIDLFRVMALEDSTQINVNSGQLTLNRGQFFNFPIDASSYITSSKPITLAQ